VHGVEIVSQGLELVSQGIGLVSQGVELVSQGVELVSQGVELVSQGLELEKNITMSFPSHRRYRYTGAQNCLAKLSEAARVYPAVWRAPGVAGAVINMVANRRQYSRGLNNSLTSCLSAIYLSWTSTGAGDRRGRVALDWMSYLDI
jgi:uncharacterized phage infection (PIP) family protein YhgE